MSPAALDSVWGLAVLALVVLAFALIVLAVWTGRWTAWVAGYLCVILALAAALVGNRHGERAEPEDFTAAASQPIRGPGVSTGTIGVETGGRAAVMDELR